MVYFHGTTDFYIEGPTAVTLGKFDGIHRGHQKLMRRILELEKADPAIRSTAFVFNSNKNDQLMTAAEQKSLIAEMGISNLVNCPFVPEITGMLPEEFVGEVLIGKLHASHVVVGTDFRFGYKRSGDTGVLRDLQHRYGFSLDVIEKERYMDREISSTYVREALSSGDMELVRALLGRSYTVEGTVVRGRHMGTGMGMPTANLVPPEEKMLPPNGVYFSETLMDGEKYRSVTNIGYKPTIGETFKGVETYMFGINTKDELYGREIRVSLLHYLRPEIRFDSIDDLKQQIRTDIRSGKEYFGE